MTQHLHTRRAVYAVFGDSLQGVLGLCKYDRLDPRPEMEFVGRPGPWLFGVQVAGENDEHIWLGTWSDVVWYSSDAGASWVARNGVCDSPNCVVGSRSGSLVDVGCHQAYCFHASTDLGQMWETWGDCSNGEWATFVMETDVFDEQHAYGYGESV